jgi:di/tricarboxylate transporter
MTTPQAITFAILGATLILFVWGRWRHDVVAMLALLAVVLTGLIEPRDAFVGFAHPAVITVAAVLVISRGLQNAGLVDIVVKAISPLRGRQTLQLAAQCFVIAALSGFMNNVGALALMLPVALRNAYRDGYPPAKSLMPLAFASLLGGLTTLIGTPPNIIIAGFRAQQLGQSFHMFDFAPVGVAVAIAGLIFLVLIGWRLIPMRGRKSEPGKAFEVAGYVTEAEVTEESKAAGLTIFELEEMADDDVAIVGLIRDQTRRLVPSGYQQLLAGDVLVLRGDSDAFKSLIDAAGLKLVADQNVGRKELESDNIDIVECVINPDSMLIDSTAVSARLRTVHGVNLIALARQGRGIHERLGHVRFRAGDVLLLQVPREQTAEILARLECLPLAEHSLGTWRQRRLWWSGGVFVAAVAVAAAGILPVQIAFVTAAVLFVASNVVRPTEVYTSIDWPVIILLAAMFPVGGAMEATGGSALIADSILGMTRSLSPAWVLLVVLVATMFISDIINNYATAVLMAPIALTVANRLGTNPDAFLIAVALGASCAFLTPIGHQSNTLVWEPGGYKFGDYWRAGLPLEVLIVAIAVPMLLVVWPL